MNNALCRRVVAALLLFAPTWSVLAQTIEEIRSSSAYYSAEGSGVTENEACQEALANISRQISVSITSKQHASSTESTAGGNRSIESSSSESNSSFSFASFQNVEQRVLSPEPNARVFCWIPKSEVARITNLRKQKIIDYVATGRIAERKLQIDDALRNYYWALMLTHGLPPGESVECDFDGSSQNCATYLPLKIKSVIAHTKVFFDDYYTTDERYFTKLRFTYDGNDVASLQLRNYNDGQSWPGPVFVKNGVCELDLVSLPSDNKLHVNIEYAFANDAQAADVDLRAIYSSVKPLTFNSTIDIPVKVNMKKNTVAAEKKAANGCSAFVAPATAAQLASVKTEPTTQRERIALNEVSENSAYLDAMRLVERAINERKPELAFSVFTPDGYKLFEMLFKNGTVSLRGKKQDYSFVHAHNQVLARYCNVSLRFRNGTKFTESLVFRFNDSDGKINSLAFSLTKKAEDDIFNAASSWTEVSRYTILQFMEDYQTAFALKRLDYIDLIYSDSALIITGAMLKPVKTQRLTHYPENREISFNSNDKNVRYTVQNKRQYLRNLTNCFKNNEFVHLTFEDNKTKVVNATGVPVGSAFAIQIRQIYRSSTYNDTGYLTLYLDTSLKDPVIVVRFWQPDRTDIVSIDEFMNKFSF